MTTIIPHQQVIPAASLQPGHITFVPVPAHLQYWLHSIWHSAHACSLALSSERCYPDGGTSVTFAIDDTQYDATVLFGTQTGNLAALKRRYAVSFRFHPGAFAECFGVPSEAVARNSNIDLQTLISDSLPPQALVCQKTLAEAHRVLVVWLTRQIHQNSKDTQRRIALVESLIGASHDCNITTLEQQLGCSTRTLQRQCKQALGLAPKEMLMFGKIYLARKSLIYTDASLSDVALASGYFDQAHFTNHFHEFVGETPAKYRQRKQKQYLKTR